MSGCESEGLGDAGACGGVGPATDAIGATVGEAVLDSGDRYCCSPVSVSVCSSSARRHQYRAKKISVAIIYSLLRTMSIFLVIHTCV